MFVKIVERTIIVYVISQLIFSGDREIVQGGGEILPKVFTQSFGKILGKLWDFKISSKPQHYP